MKAQCSLTKVTCQPNHLRLYPFTITVGVLFRELRGESQPIELDPVNTGVGNGV